ncbi:MAG: hypothetical protein KAG43_09140, partial [Candidatus Marithrix sp.]|nr:hypothetical protein [Candidatus Marithrix sp.]
MLKYWLLMFILVTPLYADDDIQTEKKHVRFINGDSYYGDYEGRKRNGEGIYIWANGDRYKGEFFEGKRDGSGIYIWNNGDRYKGDYIDNKRDGSGVYIWKNGEHFKGDFIEGKRDSGKMITSTYQLKFHKIEITVNSRGKRVSERPTKKDTIEKYESTSYQNANDDSFEEIDDKELADSEQ